MANQLRLLSLKTWGTGTHSTGEPVLVIETHEEGQVTILLPPEAAKALGEALVSLANTTGSPKPAN